MMNRKEFLARLSELIATLPEEERENAIRYYEEYFDDAGPENEARVIAELGSPEDCAQQILSAGMLEPHVAGDSHNAQHSHSAGAATGTVNAQNTGTARKGGSNGLLILLLLLFALPIGLPLVIAALAVVLSLVVAAAALLLALGVTGIVGTLAGIAMLFHSAAVGAFILGIGLTAGGIAWLLLIPLVKLMVKICVGTIRFITDRLGRLLYRNKQGVQA